MNILQAIADQNLFGPFLGDDHSTWSSWFAALSVLYGMRVPKQQRQVVRDCTSRLTRTMPKTGFDTALFLTGRRSGKSRVAALVAAFEACLAGHEKKLAKGEKGIVAVIAPTKAQASIVRGYLRAIFDTELLRGEIVEDNADGFELSNHVRITTLAGDWKTVRGYTLIAAVLDELCFFGLDEESKVRSDAELVRAVKPGLATIGGKLIGISTCYARKGWCFGQWQKHFGKEGAPTLVWNCPSRTMNSTLPQSIVDEALAEDPQSARSEYLGQWRDDVAEFIPRSLVEGLVVAGRTELLPRRTTQYTAFVDLSGGRVDDSALAIAHRGDGRKVVIDSLKRWRPPHNPHEVVGKMVEELHRFGIKRVTGDNFGAEYTAGAFQNLGVHYTKSEKPASALYLELLPRMCSGEIELLDDAALVAQLAGLERRTRSGGKDIIDHPPGGHDDLANAVAGVSAVTCGKRIQAGVIRLEL
jgi:hypothetical protein